MAHDIDMSNGRANMAYVGEKPWHGLGTELEEGLSIEEWKIAAGLNWTAEEAPVTYTVDGVVHTFDNKRILYRSDTGAGLGVVSDNRYNIVQPGDILEFYRDLVATEDFTLETAGSLKGGKVIWALARTEESFKVGRNDEVRGYFLLTTGTDGKRSTTAQFVSTRVVCSNTLECALGYDAGLGVSVRHCSVFDSVKVKSDIRLNNIEFVEFGRTLNEFSKYKMSESAAMEFIIKTMNDVEEVDLEKVKQARKINNVFNLFSGEGIGSDLESAKGTLWGAVNAITEYVDHHAGRTDDSRMTSAWLGSGRDTKNRAYKNALALVA